MIVSAEEPPGKERMIQHSRLSGDGTLKSRLSDEERSKLLVLAESLVPREEILSLCAYGPKVSGYGSEDADCDIIIVTKNFKERAPGILEPNAKSSPIIVDEAVLRNAAESPAPEELVIGRLLTVYEPLVNAEFLRGVEVEYKKRIMVEELKDIQADYGDFSSNLILPYEFFLFDKLHKRALDDPELIESYGRTFGGPQGKENLEFTLRGFREAAALLAAPGMILKTGDSVRILRGKERMKALSMLYRVYPLTTGGAIRYALHTLRNRAGFGFKTVALSRLKVMEKVETMTELDRPNMLIRLEEGVIFDDASKMIGDVAKLSGFGETYAYLEKKKGDYINSSKQLEIWGGGKRAKFILKHFPELKSAKWVLLNFWSIAAKRFNMSPLSRLNREVEAVRRLHELGIKTHRITGVILDERTLVTAYTEGFPLDKSVEEITTGKSTDTSNVEKYAQVLGKMHKAGLVYGDTKPQNALVGKEGIDLLDLEQAVERGDKAWDIAEFLYYSAKMAKQKEGMKLVAESFLNAYRAENGSLVIAKARNLRYLTPFMLFLAPKMTWVVRRALAKYSSHDGEPTPGG